MSALKVQAVLLALEARLTLLGKGAQTLLSVGCLDQAKDPFPLQGEPALQRYLEALLRDQLDLPDRNGWSRSQGRGEGDRFGQQPVRRKQAVDHTQRRGGLGVERLAGHEQFHRLLPPDQSRQTLRPAIPRQEAERDFGHAEAILDLGGKSEIGGERDLATAMSSRPPTQ